MTERLRHIAAAVAAALLLTLAGAAGAAAEGVPVGAEAEVTADDGANLRQQPSTDAEVIGLVGLARYVYVAEGPVDGWYRVEFDGDVGWVHGSLLAPARARPSSRGDAVGRAADARPAPGAPAGVRVGVEAQVEADGGVNLRREPSTDAPVMELVKSARLVYVIDGPRQTAEGPWYKVEFDGSVGWVMGTYLGSPARGAAVGGARAAAAQPTSSKSAAAARPATSRGDAIAARALQLVGSPYVWGGSSPRTGFDCSGLIAYVMGQFGIYPGRTSEVQAGAGVSVTGGDLRPGDIVVFANTYARGYSHTGIYIGGGRFVHAEDYGTGVVISPVFSGYWGRHYAGARRVS